MKKNAFILTISLLLGVLFFTGCQKEINESLEGKSGDAAASENTSNKNQENSCRLINLDWPTIGIWQFHYNDKGLADQWIIDYGFGLPLHTNTMTYDENNRLIQSNEDFFGVDYVYQFYYAGKRLTRLTRTNVDFPDDVLDFQYTYDSKGQNTRQDDHNTDTHVLMYYDALGNCTRTDIYFGNDLYYSDNYTFYAPVRNPRQNIPGVEFGFPFYGTGGISDKWWFTSNKTIIYDNGTPFLFNDYDPNQTTINTGSNNFPGTASYYDRFTEGSIVITFDYDNCGGESVETNNRYSQGNRSIESNKTTRPLLGRASAKSIKEQIQKLREQSKRE